MTRPIIESSGGSERREEVVREFGEHRELRNVEDLFLEVDFVLCTQKSVRSRGDIAIGRASSMTAIQSRKALFPNLWGDVWRGMSSTQASILVRKTVRALTVCGGATILISHPSLHQPSLFIDCSTLSLVHSRAIEPPT